MKVAHQLEAQGDSEETAVLYMEVDVPQIIARLYSEVPDEFDKATEVLTLIAVTQPELLSPHITSLVPSVLAYIPQQDDESRRSALVDLLSQLGAVSNVRSELLHDKTVLEGLVRMLRLSETMDKYSLVNLLEELLERAADLKDGQDYEKLEGALVDLLQRQFYELELESGTDEGSEKKSTEDGLAIAGTPIKAVANAIEVFELTLVLMKNHLRATSLKAGALEFLILTSINPTSSLADTMQSSKETATELRVAAISCLEEVYSRIVEDELLPSEVPTLDLESDDKLKLRSLVIVPLLDLIGDQDEVVSDKAVEVLYGRINDEDRSVEQFFWAHKGSIERLVTKLAMSGRDKEGGDEEKAARPKVHSLTEWLLSVLIQRERASVVDAFSSFRVDESVEQSLKRKLAGVLPNTLTSIQETAKSAGISLETDGTPE